MGIFGNDEPSDAPGFSNDLSSETTPVSLNNIDQELQDFFLLERRKAELNAQIHEYNDICWEVCEPAKLGTKMDERTETCLNNCVNRFIDVSLYISNRFAMTLQKSANM